MTSLSQEVLETLRDDGDERFAVLTDDELEELAESGAAEGELRRALSKIEKSTVRRFLA